MIEYRTFDTLFSIGPFSVKAWGLMAAIGFIVALFFILQEAKRRKIDSEKIYSIALLILVGGLIGSRIGWILETGTTNFVEMIKIWQGGVVWFGALIGGLIAACIYIKVKKLNLWKYLDIFAIGLPLGMAIGRIGCYLIGDHVGKATALPWAISLNGLTHPIPLYEIAVLVPLFFVIFSLRKKKLFDGALFSIYIIGYSLARFWLDFLRTDPTYAGLTVAQYASVVLFAIFGLLVYSRKKK